MTRIAKITGREPSLPSLKGQRFGEWTVLLEAPRTRRGVKQWHCRCDCGELRIVQHNMLIIGRSTRCKNHRNKGTLRHGHAASGVRTPTYNSWVAMRDRVRRAQKPGNARLSSYRTVKIDPRWDKFENFLADMGWRPPGTSLDRFDPKTGRGGDYGPGLCRWATGSEQIRNRDPFLMKCPDGEVRLIDPRA